MKLKLEYIIILILIAILILQQTCSPQPEPEVIVKTEVTYDTLVREIPSYIPVYKTKVVNTTTVDTLYNTTLIPTDTAAILADYYAVYEYNDTINDDSATIYIKDRISQNTILSRNVKYNIIYPIINTTTILPSKMNFYVGGGVGANKEAFDYIGPNLLLTTKSRQAYGLGVNLLNPATPSVYIHIYWKINK